MIKDYILHFLAVFFLAFGLFQMNLNASDVNDGNGWIPGTNKIKKDIKFAEYYRNNEILADGVSFGAYSYFTRLRITMANTFKENTVVVNDFLIKSPQINVNSSLKTKSVDNNIQNYLYH